MYICIYIYIYIYTHIVGPTSIRIVHLYYNYILMNILGLNPRSIRIDLGPAPRDTDAHRRWASMSQGVCGIPADCSELTRVRESPQAPHDRVLGREHVVGAPRPGCAAVRTP